MARILLIIASKGYQVKEYEDTKKALIEDGHDVAVASDKIGEAMNNIWTTTNVDLAVDDVKVDDYDGIYLIGGPGVLLCLDNKIIYKIFNDAEKNDKYFGAICISPRILMNAGVMKGVKMTGWNEDGELNDLCKIAKSIYINEPVVIDGKIITADGPLNAYKFGKKISEQF